MPRDFQSGLCPLPEPSCGMSRCGSRIAQAMRVGAPFFYILVRNPNERCRFDLLQTVIAAASSLQRREC